MIAQDTAAKLLDDVLYSRVLECVDTAKLCMIEMDLWVALVEQGVGSDEDARREAKAMIDRALVRLAAEDDRSPYGDDGALCDVDAGRPRAERMRDS